MNKLSHSRFGGTYVLVACICKNYHWETLQGRYRTAPVDQSDYSPIGHGIAFRKMINNKYNKVANRYQSHNAGIFQRVQSSEKGERDNDKPIEWMSRDIEYRVGLLT